MPLPAASFPPLSSPVAVYNRDGKGRAVLLCEHASNYIPDYYQHLGLSSSDLERHIAWDIGAAATAQWISRHLDIPLVCATYSRLLLDVNRPLLAQDSITTHSEDTAIPGNISLDEEEQQRRHSLYAPYHAEIDLLLAAHKSARVATAVISIHSYTPNYLGVERPWQVGVLSQNDRRLANELLADLRQDATLSIGDNQPYSPEDGVYHSIEQHGEAHNLPCAMLEIRNDLISSRDGQRIWGHRLALAIEHSLSKFV